MAIGPKGRLRVFRVCADVGRQDMQSRRHPVNQVASIQMVVGRNHLQCFAFVDVGEHGKKKKLEWLLGPSSCCSDLNVKWGDTCPGELHLCPLQLNLRRDFAVETFFVERDMRPKGGMSDCRFSPTPAHRAKHPRRFRFTGWL